MAAPYVTNQSPANGAIGVAKDYGIRFTIGDDVSVLLATVVVWINGLVVFSAERFATGWDIASTYATNSGVNGYDFELVPDRLRYYRDGDKITVTVYGEDAADSVTAVWSFYAASGLGVTVLPMILDSLRRRD